MHRYDILEKRNFIYQFSNKDKLLNIFQKPENNSFYIGIDPTASSLHVGHLSGLMVAKKLQEFGLLPIIVIGGGTALIGDPSGKDTMRKLIDEEEINKNIEAIKKQIEFIFSDNKNYILLNNATWLKKISMVEYLRDIGKHFSVNRMLSQDCVKNRLDNGISYLEFSYMILQSYDFLYLNQNYSCILQIGGADQWGNMIMGIDLIRRINKKEAECFTFPLIASSSGEKMGKTSNNALWLDASLISTYDYYQYWINTADSDLVNLLMRYTNLDLDTIYEYSKLSGKELNKVKKILAYEATKIVHGEDEAKHAEEKTKTFFGSNGNLDSISGINYNFNEDRVLLVDLINSLNIVSSKAEIKRLILGGGVYVNDFRIDRIDYIIEKDSFKEAFFLIKIGKKNINKIIIS